MVRRIRYKYSRKGRPNQWVRLRLKRAIEMRRPLASMDPIMRRHVNPQMRMVVHRRYRQSEEAR